jgi:hypothetical protein
MGNSRDTRFPLLLQVTGATGVAPLDNDLSIVL